MKNDLIEEFRTESETLCQLKNISRLLNWDHQIVMPAHKGAAQVRGRQRATLSRLYHQGLTDQRFGELVQRVAELTSDEPEGIDALSAARWIRLRRRASAVSPELVERLSAHESESFSAWREAKEKDDFSIFLPYLDKMFELKREEADQIGYEGHPYDALLDEFEPGMTTAEVTGHFRELRDGLVPIVRALTEAPIDERWTDGPFDQPFPVDGQVRMAALLAHQIGYPEHARIDPGTHPFLSASSSQDVRLVTRYSPDEIGTAIFATLHEGGHALYELNSPFELEYTPLRGGCSLGVHESQARLYENMVGRSAPFWRWFTPRFRELFPEQVSGYDWRDLYRAANRVRPSLIRVEADEVTYSLHIVLRFEIACALVKGEITAAEMPEVWNENMKELLGVKPSSDAEGCLQDIHWGDGLVGYFPTYVLGNLIGAELWSALNEQVPTVSAEMEQGELGSVRDWLDRNLHRHAAKYEPKELMQRVLGGGIRVGPFLDYIRSKYSDLYGVELS